MQHWSTIAAIPGQPNLVNGSSISIDRLIPGSIDFSTLNPSFVRPNPSNNIMQGSSIHSSQTPYNPHQTLGYHFHPALSVGAQQTPESLMSARQFQNVSLNAHYQLQFQQPGASSQHLPLSHAPVSFGQSIPYLQSLVTLSNGAIGQQYNNIPSQQHTINMPSSIPVRAFDSLKHFGALPHNQHVRRSKPIITSKTNLYISGLTETDTDDTVRALVENIVQPKSCKAMLTNGKCKGSGFIDCATEDDAEKAKAHIQECAKSTGRKLSVKYAFENEKDSLNVYVRNLPRTSFTKEMLEDMFRNYGNVTSVKLHETDAGLTGIGFVRFSMAEEAEKAVEHMNEAKCIIGDSEKPITCKLADKAGPRNRAANQHGQGITTAAALATTNVTASGAHRSQVPLNSRMTRSGLNNSSPLHALGQLSNHSSYTQHLQYPTDVQQTSVVLPSTTPHARNVLLHSAVLPNGTPNTPVPVTFSSQGPSTNSTSTQLVNGSSLPCRSTLMVQQQSANPVQSNLYSVLLDPISNNSNNNNNNRSKHTQSANINSTAHMQSNYLLNTNTNTSNNTVVTVATAALPTINATASTANTNLGDTVSQSNFSDTETYQQLTQTSDEKSSVPICDQSVNDNTNTITATFDDCNATTTTTTTTTTNDNDNNKADTLTTVTNTDVSTTTGDDIFGATRTTEITNAVSMATAQLEATSLNCDSVTEQSGAKHPEPFDVDLNSDSKPANSTAVVEDNIVSSASSETHSVRGSNETPISSSDAVLSLNSNVDNNTIENVSSADNCTSGKNSSLHIVTADNSVENQIPSTITDSSSKDNSINSEPKSDASHQKKNKSTDRTYPASSVDGGGYRSHEINNNNNSVQNRRKKPYLSSNLSSHKSQSYSINDSYASRTSKEANSNTDIHITPNCSLLNPSSPS